MPIPFLPVTQEHRDYLRDESHTVGTASHIFFPKTEAEVAQAMSAAWAADMPVTIHGGAHRHLRRLCTQWRTHPLPHPHDSHPGLPAAA